VFPAHVVTRKERRLNYPIIVNYSGYLRQAGMSTLLGWFPTCTNYSS
jgi:hypothetical protein